MSRRKFATISILFLSLLLAGVMEGTSRGSEVPRMTREELKAQLGNPEVIILDVRYWNDWRSSQYKIKGAIRENPYDLESWISKYPKNKMLVLYCA